MTVTQLWCIRRGRTLLHESRAITTVIDLGPSREVITATMTVNVECDEIMQLLLLDLGH